jgi:hypothetical protein
MRIAIAKIARVTWRLAFPISFTMMAEFIIVNDIDTAEELFMFLHC